MRTPGKPGVLVLSKHALAAMTAMMTDRSNGLQIEPRHGRDDVETGLALDAHRLESERIVESTDKTVRADADADRRSTRNANVTTGQRARAKA